MLYTLPNLMFVKHSHNIVVKDVELL